MDHVGLPDFVQDHLVVESFSGQDNPSVDLSVLREVLPQNSSSSQLSEARYASAIQPIILVLSL